MDFNQGFGGMNQNFNMGMNNDFNMNNNGFEWLRIAWDLIII